MPIVFSDHAKQQLRRRKISQKLVIEAIRSPENKTASFKDRRLWRMRIGGKILEVVTKTDGPKITVITSYYLKK